MSNSLLWYNSPAENWDEALPVGNGRLGAMVFGGTAAETLQLNEDSIWSGGRRNRNNKSAKKNLALIRRLISENRISEAEELENRAFFGVPSQQTHYQPLGELKIWSGGENITDYKRFLDLDNSIAVTEWKSEGTYFRREVIASCPDNVIAIHFTSDKEGAIGFCTEIDGRDDDYDFNHDYDEKTIAYGGKTGSDNGIAYFTAISADCKGGKVYTEGKRLFAEGCNEVTLVISCRTDFYRADYDKAALNDVRKALRKGYSAIKTDHEKDYKALYNRTSLTLSGKDFSDLPTNERIKSFNGEDKGLVALYWSFAKYLLISGSREGTLPLNLQGIWNKDMWPAWGCKYTVNINTEMNYWGVETADLPECHTPLFAHLDRMRESGRETAREMYGCGGFMCHHNTDIWGDTAPQDQWIPATIWPMGAAWLSLHIFEHYRFTGDMDFLREQYDVMREAAEFFLDYLIENHKGELVTCPSVSPENTFIAENGEKGSVCMGPTMDTQILRELFTAVIKSGEALGIDKSFGERLSAVMKKLPENKIGKYGQIMEWAVDYDEAEPGHRHISQLFGLYPADQITRRFTPDLAEAAKATIERRLSYGGGHTGWSRAWIINMWARLLEGERVSENVGLLLTHSTNPNMFDSHPPFQIDGNFGGAAGITEALLQSHSGEIRFLPALPKEWSEGEATGLKARGGFKVDFSWKNGVLEKAAVLSLCGGKCRIYSDIPLKITGARAECENGLYTFDTEKGMRIEILPVKE